jgi:YidC/Oxa1 family membrane protein insertase
LETEIITGFLYIEILYQLAFNMLVLIYNNFGQNLGVAIILFTLGLRTLTLPFTIRQVRNAKKTKEFQEKYKDLKKEYEDDQEKLTEELAKLQAAYLPAQLGGCLPLILQLVFFFQIYYVVRNAVEVGPEAFNLINYSFVPEFQEKAAFGLEFLGLDLGTSPASIGFGNLEALWPYLILVLAVGGAQFIASKVSLQLSGGMSDDKEKKEEKEKADEEKSGQKSANKPTDKSDEKGPKVDEEEYSFTDAMQQSSKQMVYFLPALTMFFSFSFPAGLSLYWAVNSGFALFQQIIIKRDKAKQELEELVSDDDDNGADDGNAKEKIIEGEEVKTEKKSKKTGKSKSKKKKKKKKK